MMQRDRDGLIPLYLQVKSLLEGQIASGKLKPHRRVPSERSLTGFTELIAGAIK